MNLAVITLGVAWPFGRAAGLDEEERTLVLGQRPGKPTPVVTARRLAVCGVLGGDVGVSLPTATSSQARQSWEQPPTSWLACGLGIDSVSLSHLKTPPPSESQQI